MSLDEARLAVLRTDATSIFTTALAACNIESAFARHLSFEGKLLRRRPSPVLAPVEQSFANVRKIQVIALGKAAVPMLDALLARLPPKLRVDGICAGPHIPEKRHRHIHYYAGSHPTPNEASLEAAKSALELLGRASRDTFVFFLVSGGGSSMFELPRDRLVSLDDLRAFYETLVLCGANITEVNTVRTYFSAVKGGRLAQAAPQAEKLTLLLADVPLKDLGCVASSPTLPDRSSWADCAAVLERWDLLPRFPATVRAYFQAMAKNPPASVASHSLEHTQIDVLLSNHDFVNAARDRARDLGYKVVIDSTPDDWPFDRASSYLLERLGALRTEWGRVCLLSGGEVNVAIESARYGCGGRNQHFALASALQMEGAGKAMVVLSAGSDGIDGNSAAAGAIADPTTAARARLFHFNPEESLARFNSCPVFTALGDAIITGPTGNNLRDLRVLLAEN